ncbi:putative UDP-glucosyltransferase [Panicum miliaceum]|uniref:UDP-glucosyltransferase n=1 Tax=Panicum miliaceum TaxID=4540 RepID=A0A3L6PKS3_PANMI|nr:putative UDP-glucosyltransferase [Panicum miliaceum]
MAKAHVLVLPFPAQGHVTPLMELSHRLVDHGFEVTFINTEVDHALVVAALRASSGGEAALGGGIHLASVPDGLTDDEDRKDLNKLIDAVLEAAGPPGAAHRRLGGRRGGPSRSPGSLLRRQETFELAPGMPPLHTSQLPWTNAGAPEAQRIIFELITGNNKLNDLAEMTVTNSFHEAEAGASKLFPNILPIGPLSADQKPVGNLLPEDGRCIKWLDAQPDRCGWNSTMEGVRNGVPFLCWPYFCDQHLNRSYITNVWRTGLAVSPGVDGIVTKEELRTKVEQVIGDAGIKERARLFADVARRCVREGGSSYENFNRLVNLLSE